MLEIQEWGEFIKWIILWEEENILSSCMGDLVIESYSWQIRVIE